MHDELDAQRALEWDGLVDEMTLPSPFLRSWWLAHVAEGRPCFVMVIDGSGALAGGLALQRSTRLGVEWLQFLGTGPLEPDHLDLLARREGRSEVARLLVGWLRRRGNRVVDLQGIVDDSLLVDTTPGWRTEELEVAPFATLPTDVAPYMASRPAKMRNTVRRTEKRLTREGVRFDVVDRASRDELDAALGALERLHDGRWGEASGFLSRWGPFVAAVRAGVDAGEVRLHRLVASDGTVIAVEVEFVVAGRMSFYQAGRLTDREWRGAGSVLRFEVIASAISESMREFDLLRGGEPYKTEWSTGNRPLRRLREGVGPLGVAIVAAARANRRVALAREARRRSSTRDEAVTTVLFYTDATQIGGAESVAKNLLRELDERFAVTVVGTTAAVVADVAGVRPSATTIVLDPIRNRRDVTAMSAHRRCFAELRPDIFHFNLSDGSSCQYAMLAAQLVRGSRIVVTENSPMGVRSELSRRIKRRSSRRFDAHVAVGNAAAAMIERDIGLRPGSLRVIPNGVPVIEHHTPPRVDQSPTVGVVSRFDPVKGIDVAVRAVSMLEGVRLVIIGDGAQRAEIEALIAELGLGSRVELMGWVDDVRHLLGNFDVFLLPSRLEGMPMSVIEAMHAGVAVVATDVGSVREVIDDGVSGLVVPPEDPAALAAAVRRLLDDEPLRRQFAEQGRHVGLERFTSARNVAAYEQLYDEVLTAPRRRNR